MIPLRLPIESDAERPFVVRLRASHQDQPSTLDAMLIDRTEHTSIYASRHGLVAVEGAAADLDGDIVLIDPIVKSADRLIRPSSPHNTLLVTERCDQLCVMCSQPPKKTHVDRFGYFQEACLAAPHGMTIGVSGGEPTLYKDALLDLVDVVLGQRGDLSFHILSNGQHFELQDVERLSQPHYRRVTWGIPLYSTDPPTHDEIVAKLGAFERLHVSMATLLEAGARIELRTVVMTTTVPGLRALARHIAHRLSFIESWSIMQLENIGFAKNRWAHLFFDHSQDFGAIGDALVAAQLGGINARLFNFPLCTVPAQFRHRAPASISDWKKKYAPGCETCRAKPDCAGFFEWHPEMDLMLEVSPL